jgi:hypothetical protein
MYVFHPEVLNEIATVPPCDIGYDLLPRLVGRAWAVLVGVARARSRPAVTGR